MSNTYYKYSKSQTDKGLKPEKVRHTDMELLLTAYVDGTPNCLQLTLQTNQDTNLVGAAYITLTQQEQDDLICGILERRSIPVHMVRSFLKEHSKDTPWRGDGVAGITATGNEQSLVHPAETNEGQEDTDDYDDTLYTDMPH